MRQRELILATVILAACGTGSGATGVTADDDASGQGDIAGTDTGADSGASDVALTDVALTDGPQCGAFMADCKTDADCCKPWRCLNITGTPKCQEEGPMQDIAVSELPQPDVLPDVPDVAPDVQPDSALTCADTATDVIPAPVCGGGGAAFFPKFSKTCTVDSDCAIAKHQINCCGTFEAWGLMACEVGPFSQAEKTCEGQYPGCGCAAFQTMAEDGYSTFDDTQFGVKCVTGTCRTFVKDAKPECTSQGLLSPKPVKACSQDSDCDFSMRTLDCCGSQIFTGIAKFAKTGYDAEQDKCSKGMAICDCMPKPTTLDDGAVLTTNAVPVHCVSGSCLTGKF